ncbi:MAG: rod shape-determining protein RodA [Bacteroidales bacterium]|nr:rod shape-determining protein RodA [Candidatus Cacconaster equifaecalis]
MSGFSYKKLDWILISLYLVLVIFGWMNIYSSSHQDDVSFFSLSTKYMMHLIWIATAFFLAAIILFSIPSNIYTSIALPLYILFALLLIAVAFVGVEINGSKSWFALGPFRLQPAEFSKLSTSLLIASLLGHYDFSFTKPKCIASAVAVILLPILFILMEKETGSALVYLGFLLVFFREGMNGWILILGLLSILLFIVTLVASPTVAVTVLAGIIFIITILYYRKRWLWAAIGTATVTALAFIPDTAITLTIPAALAASLILAFKKKKMGRNLLWGYVCGVCLIMSVQFIYSKVLQDHQRARIEVLLGIRDDPRGVGYNVHQSLIAIGSGGLVGKGYMNGTQTHYDFVPEQSTDFIFCTVGEEWGFVGSVAVLACYLALILHLMNSAEKHNDRFTRIYGYCTASCLLMHVMINVNMTIGLMPVIGIPLPFLSYGGSSLWAFTLLLFIYIKLDYDHKTNR